ncbi:TetR/AcrR family transcriptional regulator [Cellulosilyticum sp. I15G10I2]|uniref:TetR/AcrR family transcriptional regulator n=1 Tax=Cellulosilyticum sp. I15G10I2 TaxID=1892843 RepID=UPI00085BC3FD|nr:TetR/AcrR family transcriptional regulator [Cellulosilyticum sp. I15G10I2]
MARTKEQNDKMSLLTRGKIETVALKLFAQKGFAMTSIKDIAAHANISTGLIYRHFSSKEELFSQLVTNTIDELSGTIQFFDSDIAPADIFRKITRNVIQDIQSSKEISYYFLLVSRLLLEGEALPQAEELQRSDLLLFNHTAELIKKGQALGAFKSGDPYTMSLFFYSVIQGIANMKLFMQEKYKAPEVQDVLAFLLK